MKEPWILNICCCCRGSSGRAEIPRADGAGVGEFKGQDLKLENQESGGTTAATTADAVLAERAIDSALRLSFHSGRSRGCVEGGEGVEEEDGDGVGGGEGEGGKGREPPPPSYATVLQDNELRTPPPRASAAVVAADRRIDDEISTVTTRLPQTQEAPETEVLFPISTTIDPDRKTGAGTGNPMGESVLSSSGDSSDLVLTPPTTAPPTVVDEDSEDDERFYPRGR